MQKVSHANDFKTAKSIRAIVGAFFYFVSKKINKKNSRNGDLQPRKNQPKNFLQQLPGYFRLD